MNSVDRTIKTWLNNPLVKADKILKDEVLERVEFIVQDGLFEHHKTLAYIGADDCFYYLTYFGLGWNKRKPNKEGWCKYLNAMAYNIHTGEIAERRKVF